MFKKRTSKHYRRERDCLHMLHLNVNSPRIVLFKSMSAFAGVFKVTLVLCLLCLGGWGVMCGANSLFTENREYALKNIDLKTNGSFSKQRVVDLTRIKADATLFAIDPLFMEETLEAQPEVMEASVTRKLPGTLLIEIKERVPVAWLHAPYLDINYRDKKKGLLIGEDGVLFPCEGRLWDVSKNLPAVVVEKGEDFVFRSGEKMLHEEAIRALSLVLEHKNVLMGKDWKLLTLTVVDFYTLVAEYSDDVMVTFGMYDHRRQLADLEDIRAHAKNQDKEIKWLDLRPKRNIPGQYKVSKLY